VKEKLLELTRSHARAVAGIQKRVGRYTGGQVQAVSILSDVQAVSTVWFDQVKPALDAASVSPGLVANGTDIFDRMLRQSKRKPRKAALMATIAEGVSLYRDMIHNIETASFASASTLSIAPYVEGLSTDEGEYLAEAQRCLDVNALRGCIVLGWCATIARIQAKLWASPDRPVGGCWQISKASCNWPWSSRMDRKRDRRIPREEDRVALNVGGHLGLVRTCENKPEIVVARL
jgi:hypothetical protein